MALPRHMDGELQIFIFCIANVALLMVLMVLLRTLYRQCYGEKDQMKTLEEYQNIFRPLTIESDD